jgi:hypothetical protein
MLSNAQSLDGTKNTPIYIINFGGSFASHIYSNINYNYSLTNHKAHIWSPISEIGLTTCAYFCI